MSGPAKSAVPHQEEVQCPSSFVTKLLWLQAGRRRQALPGLVLAAGVLFRDCSVTHGSVRHKHGWQTTSIKRALLCDRTKLIGHDRVFAESHSTSAAMRCLMPPGGSSW